MSWGCEDGILLEGGDREKRRLFAHRIGVADLSYPDGRMADFFCQEGIEGLSLTEVFRARAEETQVPLHGFANATLGRGHWNELGHELAGNTLAEHLCEARWLAR